MDTPAAEPKFCVIQGIVECVHYGMKGTDTRGTQGGWRALSPTHTHKDTGSGMMDRQGHEEGAAAGTQWEGPIKEGSSGARQAGS